MNCTACTRPLDHAAQLCAPCVRGLDVRLTELPGQYLLLVDHLRPGAARGDGPVALVREAPLPVREDVLTMRAEGGIVAVLESWRSAMQDARGWGQPARSGSMERRVLAAARGLLINLDWVAAEFEAAGDLAREIRTLAAQVNALLDPAPPALSVGDCAADLGDDICGAPLRVPAGTTDVRCRRCGTEYPPHMWMTLATGAWATPEGAAA
ncbi:hypothetical protein [Streptomyces sp. Isolate_219]|uniref:hypothetical protein n=1 Tax=Streptomyces sp. Isolate_219 TaxID=2950110 RepID=UPI0021C79BA6|nr:hypothetical protein [Streptomyces sp. Isolate_219]MCR8574717.1 hypothetical protein [Streptomyces sp. Isolate_219]